MSGSHPTSGESTEGPSDPEGAAMEWFALSSSTEDEPTDTLGRSAKRSAGKSDGSADRGPLPSYQELIGSLETNTTTRPSGTTGGVWLGHRRLVQGWEHLAEHDDSDKTASTEWTEPERGTLREIVSTCDTQELYGLARGLNISGRGEMDQEELRDEVVTVLADRISPSSSTEAREVTDGPSSRRVTAVLERVLPPDQLARLWGESAETSKEATEPATADGEGAINGAIDEDETVDLESDELADPSTDGGRTAAFAGAGMGEAPTSALSLSETGLDAAEDPDTDGNTDRLASIGFSPELSDRMSNDPSSPAQEGETRGDGHVPDIPSTPGSATLIACESHSESRRKLCFSHLGLEDTNETNILLIRCRELPTDQLKQITTAANDVTLVTLGYDQNVPDAISDDITVQEISKTKDLRRLGIVVTRAVQTWSESEKDLKVCFDSLNVLMRYSDVERLFRFLHVLIGQLKSTDAAAHFHLDPSGESTEDVSILRTLFDSVIDAEDDDIRGSEH